MKRKNRNNVLTILSILQIQLLLLPTDVRVIIANNMISILLSY